MLKNIYERLQLEKLLKNKTATNDFDAFTRCSPAYLATNENQAAALENFEVKDKDVLCVTSSGDFALNALSLGARKVTTFDINKFAKYVLELKVATVKTYPDETLYASFWLSNSPTFLSYAKFLEIRGNLSKEAYDFWNYVYTYLNNNKNTLDNTDFFRNTIYNTITLQERFNLYYKKSYYEQLRKRILTTSIDSYDLDITKINTLKSNYQFDVVYLSNILQYYATINALDSKEKVYRFLESINKELLKNNGTLVASYNFFGCLVEFIDNLAFDPRDVTNYLILKYPQDYKLITIAGLCPDLDDGICLSRKI